MQNIKTKITCALLVIIFAAGIKLGAADTPAGVQNTTQPFERAAQVSPKEKAFKIFGAKPTTDDYMQNLSEMKKVFSIGSSEEDVLKRLNDIVKLRSDCKIRVDRFDETMNSNDAGAMIISFDIAATESFAARSNYEILSITFYFTKEERKLFDITATKMMCEAVGDAPTKITPDGVQITTKPFEPSYKPASEKFVHPKEIVPPDFRYPFEVRSGICGEAVILVELDGHGKAKRLATLSCTIPEFAEAAIRALQKARWDSTKTDWFYYKAVYDLTEDDPLPPSESAPKAQAGSGK